VAHGETEEEWRKLFEFAKYMGIETINSEPAPQFLDLVDQLANEFEINVAIHNHPIPTRYYHPDSVLNALEGRSARMGACGDIGHWVRSGLDPVDCIEKLEGRLMSFHFKDLKEKSRDTHDVIWGTGISDVEGILRELKRQGFKGVFTVEYEHNWDNNMPEVIASAKYFNQVAASLRMEK
jgi:sugar phosphate isomerase/epimerase